MARGSKMTSGLSIVDSKKTGDGRANQSAKSSPDDQLNGAIVSMLQDDGRMAFSEIAAKLGVSEGTIRNRVANMKQAGMLRIVAIVDPEATEYKTDAMLGLKIAPGHTPQAVAERLAELPDVVYILWVSGQFELLVELVCEDRNAFLEFLDTAIYGNSDILSCETMTGLKNYKNQFLLKTEWEAPK